MTSSTSELDSAPDRGTPASAGGETATAVYHVNDHQGRVLPHGEDLEGRDILSRAGFSTEKYQLFEIDEHGKTGPEIKPDEVHHVKPGDHYRATIRGTDYSSSSLT